MNRLITDFHTNFVAQNDNNYSLQGVKNKLSNWKEIRVYTLHRGGIALHYIDSYMQML